MGRTLIRSSILAVALLLCQVRPVLAGPPKLEISNTAVIIASSVLGVALATTAIINHFRSGNKHETKKEEVKEEKKEKEYKPKSKDDLKNELKKMRRTPADLDKGDQNFDKPESSEDGYGEDSY